MCATTRPGDPGLWYDRPARAASRLDDVFYGIKSMRLFFKYFFKTLRLILGPVLLFADWLTSPRGVLRPAEEQAAVDQATRDLVLYQFKTCPFCIKTRRAIKRLSLKIEMRDAQHDAQARAQLLEGGGRLKVPCLRLVDEAGEVRWLYESDDIIAYLQACFSSAAGEGAEPAR